MRGRLFRPTLRRGLIAPIVVLQAACAPSLERAADPYANCADLGTLALASASRADAESRMKQRVLELGGDTLLFGERGRSGRLAEVPPEIVERRAELLSAQQPDSNPEAGPVPDAESPPTGDEPNGRPTRTGSVAQEPVPVSPGELWYYGAALRCNR